MATLAVIAAVAWPWVAHSAFLDQVETITRTVEGARVAVEAYRDAEGAWPPPAPAGQVPDGLGPYMGDSVSFQGEGYRLQMRRWRVSQAPPPQPELPEDARLPPTPSDSTPAPQPQAVPLTGLTLHAGDEALLAVLLSTYGSSDSFVRDTTWTLVFPLREDP